MLEKKSFLGKIYRHDSVFARSSDAETCLQTAQAFLDGLFNDRTLNIAVHSIPVSDDNIFHAAQHCQAYELNRKEVARALTLELESESHTSPLKNKIVQVLQRTSKVTGIPCTIMNIEALSRTIFAMRDTHVHKLNATREYLRDLDTVYRHILVHMRTASKKFAKWIAGNLLREIVERIARTIASTSAVTQGHSVAKFGLFVANDLVLSAILVAMGRPDLVGACISPLSHLRIELMEAKSAGFSSDKRAGERGTFYIRTKLNGTTFNLKDCSTLCPVHRFAEIVAESIPSTAMEWSAECSNNLAEYGPASDLGYLGINYQLWAVLAFFQAFLLALLSAVLQDRIQLDKKWSKRSDSVTKESFFSLPTTSALLFRESVEDQRRVYMCVRFSVGAVASSVILIVLLAFGFSWKLWPIICFMLALLNFVEAAALAMINLNLCSMYEEKDFDGIKYSRVADSDSDELNDSSDSEHDHSHDSIFKTQL